MLDRSSNNISISEFYENHLLGKYDYDPPYQRKSVWDSERKSFLIDSILKNFPIPPIFLRKHVDVKTGKTRYDVVDGKQRLTSIIEFIEGKIALPDYFGEDKLAPEELNGLKFNELDTYPEYKSRFWKYEIPIEYLDFENNSIAKNTIENIFDRLNRNGMPLNYQELRNAKYHNSKLLEVIIELSKEEFWKKHLKSLSTRMEDIEFISELLFELLEDKIFNSSNKELDDLYEKWIEKFKDEKFAVKTKEDFRSVTDLIVKFDLDYNKYGISGISHLYGIWCFSHYCFKNNISVDLVKEKINLMFRYLSEKMFNNESLKLYKESMSYRTRSKSQREKRLNAIINFVGCKR